MKLDNASTAMTRCLIYVCPPSIAARILFRMNPGHRMHPQRSFRIVYHCRDYSLSFVARRTALYPFCLRAVYEPGSNALGDENS